MRANCSIKVLLSEGREGRRELMVSYSILAKAITSYGVELYATRFGNSKFFYLAK